MIQMVIAPITFNLSKVDYFRDKDHQIDQAKAKATEQPSHPEMVKSFTDFIDGLIKLEVGRLEATASDNSHAKAQEKAQRSLIKYHAAKDSTVTPFVQELAGDLAKNIYVVKKLLIEGGLAEHKDNQELTFKVNNTGAGGTIAAESAKELAKQALESIKERLSACGITIDTAQRAQLAEEIKKELKKPPKLKSEVDITTSEPASTAATTETTTCSETTVNPQELLTQFNKFITEISNLPSVQTLLEKNNGLETLSKLNQDLANLNPIIQDRNTLQAALGKAFKALDNETHANNKTFINNYLANPKKFKEEFETLNDDSKLQIQMTLINIEGQAKQTKSINNIVSSIAEIKQGLGSDRLGNLLDKLQSINSETTSQNQENHLDTINSLLNDFNQYLKTANQAESRQDKRERRNEVTEAFIEKLNTGLTDGSLSNADIKLIQEHLDPKKTEEQSQKSITEQVFKNSIKNLNLSEEELKGFAGIAVATVIGLMVFCPNAIGNLVKSGTGLAAMAAQTLPMLFQAQAIMQISNKTQTAST